MSTLRHIALEIYTTAKNYESCRAKEEYLLNVKKDRRISKSLVKQLEAIIIEEILNFKIDHVTIDLCQKILNLDIKRNYLVQFCELNLPNDPIRQILGKFSKTELYFIDSNTGIEFE